MSIRPLTRALQTLFVPAAAIAALCSLAACSATPRDDGSAAQAIATDFGAPAASQVHLYWVTGTQIGRGECEPGKVILKTNCLVNVKTMPYARFIEKLDDGMTATVMGLRGQTSALVALIDDLGERIEELRDVLIQKSRERGHSAAELAALNERMNRFEVYVSEYKEQLALIEAQLARAGADQDLRVVADQIALELAQTRQDLAGIYLGIDDFTTELDVLSAEIQIAQTQTRDLEDFLADARVELGATLGDLVQIEADFSKYNLTLERLTSTVAFKVLGSNDWHQQARPFVRRFDDVFAPAVGP